MIINEDGISLPGGTITPMGIRFRDNCTQEQHMEIGRFLTEGLPRAMKQWKMEAGSRLSGMTKAQLQERTKARGSRDELIQAIIDETLGRDCNTLEEQRRNLRTM